MEAERVLFGGEPETVNDSRQIENLEFNMKKQRRQK